MSPLVDSRREQMFPVLSAAQVEVARRFASGEAHHFAPGELIYDVGEVVATFWLVLEGSIDVVRRDGLGREARSSARCRASSPAKSMRFVVRRRSPRRGPGRTAASPCRSTEAHLRALLVGSAEIGEIIMRALILRRVGLLQSDRVGSVLVGSANDPDLVRLQGFLTRNGYPQTVLDPGADEDAQQLIISARHPRRRAAAADLPQWHGPAPADQCRGGDLPWPDADARPGQAL